MDIEKLLGDYGRALATGDVEALVECYGFPCTTLSDDFVTTYTDADELRVELEEANEHYTGLGSSDVRFELLGDERISERITRVCDASRFMFAPSLAGPIPSRDSTSAELVGAEGAVNAIR